MKKQDKNRKFNVSDADLYVQVMDSIRNAHRDIQFFETYGYDLDRLKALQTQAARFQALPDDHELIGDQMIMTEKKNQAAKRLRTAIRSLMTRVAMKYHDKTGRYRKFGTSKLGDMSDPQLLFCGRRVARVAQAQIDFLAEVGMTQQIIQRVVDAASDMERAMNIQQDKLHDRDISVERRTDVGNKIYDEMIILCDIGKDIWHEKDPVKYEQYCVYESNNEQKKARKAREGK